MEGGPSLFWHRMYAPIPQIIVGTLIFVIAYKFILPIAVLALNRARGLSEADLANMQSDPRSWATMAAQRDERTRLSPEEVQKNLDEIAAAEAERLSLQEAN